MQLFDKFTFLHAMRCEFSYFHYCYFVIYMIKTAPDNECMMQLFIVVQTVDCVSVHTRLLASAGCDVT